MKAFRWCARAALVLATLPALAQVPVGGPPPAVWEQIQAIGPILNGAAVYKVYGPLRTAMPTEGVERTSDVAYGPDPLHTVDIYRPSAPSATPRPVLIFVHGGGFVGGTNKVYDNIGNYYARQGLVVMLPNYRLAPAHPWPAGAEDTAAAVRWVKAHAAQYGGDPEHVFLYGHSAGAVHSAAYALEKRFQPPGGSGLAGVILASGMYDPSLDSAWGVAWLENVNRPYFGSDKSLYRARATAWNLDAPRLPTLMSSTELDPYEIVIGGAALFTRLCQRDGECPSAVRLLRHNHFSSLVAVNTGDETVTAPVLDFIRSH